MNECNFIQLKATNQKEEKTLGNIISIILNHVTYQKKEGVEILNLIAKSGNEDILENYFTSLSNATPQLAGIFYTAIEQNCLELVNLMIQNDVYLNSNYGIQQNVSFIKHSLETVERCGYTEMVNIISSLCEKNTIN